MAAVTLKMTKLSPSVFFYRPAPSTSKATTNAPKLIFLATWMDAQDVHVAKYITRYQELYPTACILLAKSFFRYYFSPSSARREVAPAVDVIRDVLGETEDGEHPRMLVHIFSNGGSCIIYHLYDLCAETTPSPASAASKAVLKNQQLLPPHVTIFDSVPGRYSSGSTRAILVSLPAGWIRILAWPLVQLLGLWWIIKYRLLKMAQETQVWGLAHNDPGRALEICRAYIYSEADEFVDHRHVEEHADHAEINGYVVVRRDKFENSQHVAHARSDPDRYWSLVRSTWESGQLDGEN
ncbi:Transmembrane protein [Lachnellula suecica]|uniref:Transmembrane protein n=1 Tax=Lachnellula suecica TaxID=602035 RepID=A0A8T9CJ40_9HELO|nr:Transmembrane protein [Lachnellula suecica]